jgi:hypothetical protein
MADEMEETVAVAATIAIIAYQPVDMIIRAVARVGPRAGRIAALARGHRAIARSRKCCRLRASNAWIPQTRAAAAPAAHRLR